MNRSRDDSSGVDHVFNLESNQPWHSLTMTHLIGFISGTLTAIYHLKYHANNDKETTSAEVILQ
jgi:ABC-type uncharacterized transport system permease subunit